MKSTAAHHCFFCGCVAVFLSMSALHVVAAENAWRRFRGPNGAGVSQTAFPVQWKEHNFRWVAELAGVGHGSPVVWQRHVFAVSGDEKSGRRILVCLDAESGQQRWRREYSAASHRKHKLNSFASSTPAVDEEHLFYCWGTPETVAVIALTHQGDEVWRVDLGPFQGGHGFGVSPIVLEDLLILPNEQQGESQLVALDRNSGALRWRVTRDSKVAYSTPCVLRRSESQQDVVFTNWEQGVVGIDPASGKVRWQADVFDKGHIETAIGSPVLANDLVIGVCGWLGVKQQVIAVRAIGKGENPKAKEVWRIERAAPLCTTPLVVENLVFLWADDGIVTCADSQTGQIHWRRRVGGSYYSSPVCAAGVVYNISTSGEVVALAAQPEFQLLARSHLPEGAHSTPAIANDTLYVKTFSKLFAIAATTRTDEHE